MLDMSKDLLALIEEHLAETGISAGGFGRKAIKNGRIVERLRSGGRVWPETEMQIRVFLASQKQRKAA